MSNSESAVSISPCGFGNAVVGLKSLGRRTMQGLMPTQLGTDLPTSAPFPPQAPSPPSVSLTGSQGPRAKFERRENRRPCFDEFRQTVGETWCRVSWVVAWHAEQVVCRGRDDSRRCCMLFPGWECDLMFCARSTSLGNAMGCLGFD